MSLPRFAVENRALMHFIEVLLILAGGFAYLSLGRLEDPDYSIKRAVITTAYPGASPREVELEVTDRIEKALQEMPQLDRLYSISRAGFSVVRVDIKASYWSDVLPQVWDEMRKKIRDVESRLPPGVEKPVIGDDYGFVYGFVLALTGDGFTPKQLEDYADFLKKELSLVPGVSRVELWGNLDKTIFIDVTEQQLAELGLTAESFTETLGEQNQVVDAGYVDVGNAQLRVEPTGEFRAPEEIGELALRPTLKETIAGLQRTQRLSGTRSGPAPQSQLRQGSTDSAPSGDELLRIRDVGSVRRGYRDPPRWMMRFNGEPAIALSIANIAGGNIIDTGHALEERLDALRALLPVGLEIQPISWQSHFVEDGIDSFMHALRDAMVIVLGIVTLALGWRLGLVVGSGLLLSVLGVFVFMAVVGIDLHRISLGALIIALGMIVDDIIVVSDLYLVKLQKGVDKVDAAVEAASENAKPLFWATTVAAFAFFPIFLSPEGAGEFCRSLFLVVGASLWISWIFAMTLTPVRCITFLPTAPGGAGSEGGEAEGRLKGAFRRLLVVGIGHRISFLGTGAAVLAVALMGFGSVRQEFFPYAERTQLLIDYWGRQGTRIDETSAGLAPIEAKLRSLDYVRDVSAFIGQGPPRFYLPVDGEFPYPEYAQLLVNTQQPEDVERLIQELRPWVADHAPQAMVRFRQLGVGPATTWKFELRFMGPSEAHLVTLRAIGEEAMGILRQSPSATDVRLDLRQPVKKVVPAYDQERARYASISRPDLGSATKRLRDGIQVGLYREGDDLIPIVLRNVSSERRRAVSRLPGVQVRPEYSTATVPLGQVINGVQAEWEDPIIARYDRRRQVAVQASPVFGQTFPSLHAEVLEAVNRIELPRGYRVLWDGEFRDSIRAKRSLIPGMVPAAVIMLTILVYLFNAYRPPLVILLTLPFAMIGITAGLLIFGKPFGFVAILGVLSLSGIMIRNSVVLLETIDHQVAAGKTRYQAVIDATLSRARPVLICAIATGLGLVPLFPDVFWGPMAAAMLCGLLVGTLLTLILAPVLYALLYRLKAPEASASGGAIASGACGPAT